MAQQTVDIHLTDNRTVFAFELEQNSTPIDITGDTVSFHMVDSNGVDVIAKTATGITITAAATGQGQFDFADAGVATAGRYYAYVIVDTGGDTDHFPVKSRDLVICIHGDA